MGDTPHRDLAPLSEEGYFLALLFVSPSQRRSHGQRHPHSAVLDRRDGIAEGSLRRSGVSPP